MKVCEFCGDSFIPNKHRPDQKYCGKGRCTKKKRQENSRKRYAADPERYREKSRKHRRNNPEKYRRSNRKSNKKYYKTHIEECKERNRKCYEENAERMLRYKQEHYEENKHRALAYKGGKCIVTGSTDLIEFHHLNPNKKGIDVSNLYENVWASVKVELDNDCIPLTKGMHTRLHNEMRGFIRKLKKSGYNPKL